MYARGLSSIALYVGLADAIQNSGRQHTLLQLLTEAQNAAKTSSVYTLSIISFVAVGGIMLLTAINYFMTSCYVKGIDRKPDNSAVTALLSSAQHLASPDEPQERPVVRQASTAIHFFIDDDESSAPSKTEDSIAAVSEAGDEAGRAELAPRRQSSRRAQGYAPVIEDPEIRENSKREESYERGEA